ncbi:hypothetical protein A1Q2_00472 [Trichosporon asahii var. asahii CBS 8904]|uniref:F-box domain-containing protein n=1 Tax=Trichosporon asahii var. asahii (strain CBS 8904) TaxID=1220162 RepID=K1W0B2_TRIAC|nr:hypothetical protein A1Q2_00472 [Trichosporon asahii var. asahii CBS 8904]
MSSPLDIEQPPALDAAGSVSPESPRLQTPRTPPFTSVPVAKYRRTSTGGNLSLSPLQLPRRRSSSNLFPFPYDEDPSPAPHAQTQAASNLPLPPGAAPAMVAPFALLEGATVVEEPMIAESPAASTHSRPASSYEEPTTPGSTISSSSGSRLGAAVRRGLDRRRSRQSIDEEGSPRPSLRSLSFLRRRSMSFSTAFEDVPREDSVPPTPPPSKLESRESRPDSPTATSSRKMFPKKKRGLPPPRGVVLAAGVQSTAVADELVWGTLSYRALPEPDLFGSMLPRELQLKVFAALLESWAASPGHGKWDGALGGRRELVRLSRVSTEWRSLVFDGSLWSDADMSPLAGVLHRNTLRQIMSHARPCVRHLSLRGLDSVAGLDLKPCLSTGNFDWTALTRLDVRGAQSLSVADLVDLIRASPRLEQLVLKGWKLEVRPALAAVLELGLALTELDVSRCQGLEFGAIEEFIASLSPRQSSALRTLRISGLADSSGQKLFNRLAQLPHLTTLDLLGCRWLSQADIQEYVDYLPAEGSPLQHLVLSSCTNLTTDAVELLIGKLPNMRIFEAASLEPVFYMDPPPLLSQLVRSMPLLTHLDLDETGRYGAVDNAVLYELIPGAVPQSPLRVSHLKELRIGSAKEVSASCLVALCRGLPQLRLLAADGTKADGRVLREFLRSRPSGAYISLVDCHRLSNEAYNEAAILSRPRAGDSDLSSTPFEYADAELEEHRNVVKSFWGWRRATPPMVWRQAREVGELNREIKERGVQERGRGGYRWWQDDFDELERGACTIM